MIKFSCILFLFLPFLSLAQDYSGLIENQKFEKAWKKCQKVLKKDPESIEELYFSALIQSRVLADELFDPIQAQQIYKKAQLIYKEISDQRKLEKLDEIPINLKAFRILNDSISNGALIQAKKKNTEQGYIDYLSLFSSVNESDKQFAVSERNRLAFLVSKNENSEQSYQRFLNKYPTAIEVDEAKKMRNQVAFSTASELNTIEAFEDFLKKYPDATEKSLAQSKRNAIAFRQAKEMNNIESFEKFIAKYPDAKEVSEAKMRIHEIAFEHAKATKMSKPMKLFIEKYPNSIQIEEAKKIVDDCLYVENVDEGNWMSLKTFALNYPTNRNIKKARELILSIAHTSSDPNLLEFVIQNYNSVDSIVNRYYSQFTKDGEISTLEKFKNKFPQYLESNFYLDYANAQQANKLFLHLPYDKNNYEAYLDYLMNSPDKELSFVVVQRILSNFIQTKKYSEAIILLDKLPVNHADPKIVQLKGLLKAKNDPSISPKSLTAINSSGNEFSPVISADDKTLFFCGQNREDNIGGEDIFESTRGMKGFSTPSVSSLSTPFENEAPVGISSDGTKMILFQSGKLFVSEKLKSGWTSPIEMDENINSGIWQGDAMLSSDGNVLFFSAIRPGETYNRNNLSDLNYHGDVAYPTDIFICQRDNEGNWNYPKNIGATINTPFCDRFPFLHPDMKTLYFSSDGHGGLGKLDVFKTTRLKDSCWDCWSEPINLGKEINTIESDAGYKISTLGDVAYFTQNKRKLQESSVMFILDISGSMSGEKIQKLKEVSKKTILEVINNNSEIAISAFDGECSQAITAYLPFTKDFSEVEYFIDNLEVNGGTPMYEAYYEASNLLKSNNKNPIKNRIVVLMTDGDATSCNPLNAILNQLKLSNSLFKTQTIAYGVTENSKAYNDLNQIANFSGGEFFAASSTQDLGSAFEQVNNSIFQIVSGSDNRELVEINLPAHLRPDFVAKIEGELKNSKNEPIATTIRWEDLEADKVIGIAKTDPRDGSYFIALPLGKNYGYFVEDSSYFPVSNNLDLRNVTTQIEVNNDIQVITFQEMIDQGISVSMNNLFFDFGKYNILPESYPELKRIAKIIRRYNLKVEIDGHTDDVGDDQSNLTLSDKRAAAVKDYLVRIGCNADMLITHGFGESKPLNSNDSDAHRAKNRRVELKLIK
jgi:outer membrane protein OmpA-like peptidoglycan-associated protein/Mg-chelatase subunit ChlD